VVLTLGRCWQQRILTMGAFCCLVRLPVFAMVELSQPVPLALSQPTNTEATMPSIGRVTRQSDGSYKGQLATLSIRQNVQFLKNRKLSEGQPDFIIMAGADVEIGAAWLRTAISSGKEYLSISLAAPEFGNRTLYANLGRAAGSSDDAEFAIIWNPQD
jgi:uncharacterized protein (DUF736 family)